MEIYVEPVIEAGKTYNRNLSNITIEINVLDEYVSLDYKGAILYLEGSNDNRFDPIRWVSFVCQDRRDDFLNNLDFLEAYIFRLQDKSPWCFSPSDFFKFFSLYKKMYCRFSS